MAFQIHKQPNFPTQKASFLLPGPSGVLEVCTQQPTSAQASTTIICHPHPLMGGTMHNKVITTVAQACQVLNRSTIRFNFRGVGRSEGTFAHGQGELEDLFSVIQWLQGVAPSHKLTLVGFSFGSFIAASAEQHYDLAHLLLIAPPVERFDFQSLPSFRCPWTVIQGQQDVTVNPEAVSTWVNSRSPLGQYHLMPKADHFFHGQLLALRELVTQSLCAIP